MWAGVVLVLLVPGSWAQYPGDQYEESDTDFYDSEYDQETTTMTVLEETDDVASETESYSRNRRYGGYETIRTLNPDEIHDVKGFLQDILYGTKIDTLTSPAHKMRNPYTNAYDYVEFNELNKTGTNQERVPSRNLHFMQNIKTNPTHPWTKVIDKKWDDVTKGDVEPALTAVRWSPKVTAGLRSPEPTITQYTSDDTMTQYDSDGTGSQYTSDGTAVHWEPDDTATHWTPKGTAAQWRPDTSPQWTPQQTAAHWSPETTGYKRNPKTMSSYLGPMVTVEVGNSDSVLYAISSTTDEEDHDSSTTTDADIQDGYELELTKSDQKPHLRDSPTPSVTTTRRVTTTMTTTPRPTTTRSPMMDINAIIAIIANLTYDYEFNLTERFNLTLMEHGVPTCPTPSTVSTTTTTPPFYDFSNSSVVSKCFVCGLDEGEIPHNAFCADAFAGDFLPLMPVDPRARGQIATYRKYCRFLDVHNYVENPSESRAIYGRFTGGCGVRWTDLSGIYTQRTCRNRFKPLMGKHFASKRMAKLELALINVDNGCIISPMASLLPLSRGISLYARFHACVCTGNWCNKAIRIQQWKAYVTILWYWIINRILN